MKLLLSPRASLTSPHVFFSPKLLRPQRRLPREEDSLGVYNCLAVLAKKISEEQAIVVADASCILKSLT